MTIGNDTTYIDGPLGSDASVDYVSAINDRASNGATPDNNAAAQIVRADHPDTDDISLVDH